MRTFFCPTTKGRRVRKLPEKSKKSLTKECLPLSALRTASLTVEAAFVLPVFLFAMLVFLYLICFLQGYEKIQQGLTVAAKATSQDAVLAKEYFYDDLEKNGGNFCYIAGEGKGISLAASRLNPLDESVTMKASYWIRFPVPYFSGAGIEIEQVAKSRVFSGVIFWGGTNGEAAEELVYLTEYGTVYHRHRSCSYLNPSIHMCPGGEIWRARNNKGGKYKPCSVCARETIRGEKNYYITEEGDCFHTVLGCSGLKRTVYEVPLSSVAGLSACSKCGR